MAQIIQAGCHYSSTSRPACLKADYCDTPLGEFLYNWSFDCGLDGWQGDPSYPADVTDNGDGSIHIKAIDQWGSVQPLGLPFQAGDYTVRIGVSSMTGNGKFSYRIGSIWHTHSPLELGENIFSFTANGEINNFVVGADADTSFEADVMYISMRDSNAEMQIIPCDMSGWTVSASDYWPGYDATKAFNCTASAGGDAWVSADGDIDFPKYLQANRLNDEEAFIITRLKMKGRSVISNDHMSARRPNPLVLQGSNDGVTWVEIDRWTTTSWNAGETKTFTVADGSAGHSRFRIVWEDNGGDPIDGAQMGAVWLYGIAVPANREAVTYNSTVLTYNGVELSHGIN